MKSWSKRLWALVITSGLLGAVVGACGPLFVESYKLERTARIERASGLLAASAAVWTSIGAYESGLDELGSLQFKQDAPWFGDPSSEADGRAKLADQVAVQRTKNTELLGEVHRVMRTHEFGLGTEMFGRFDQYVRYAIVYRMVSTSARRATGDFERNLDQRTAEAAAEQLAEIRSALHAAIGHARAL